MLFGKRQKSKNYAVRMGLLVLPLVITVALTGCATGDMADLESYVADVKARKSKDIEPLPEVKVPEVYYYTSSKDVDPFEAFAEKAPDPVATNPELEKRLVEQRKRVREELELFPLDALRMVGTLEKGSAQWGLITAPDGAVHRVKVGNYMGRNYGKVTMVAEDHMELLEIVPDSIGSWEERPARIDLAE